MVQYLQFLSGLIAAFQKYGERFPALWAIAMQIAAKTQEALVILQGGAPATKMMAAPGGTFETFAHHLTATHTPSQEAPSEEVLAKEQELKNLLSNHAARHLRGPMDANLKAIGDGTLLRALFAFMQANPQLMTLILQLLGVKLPGSSVQV